MESKWQSFFPSALPGRRVPVEVTILNAQERFASNSGLKIRFLDNDPADPVGLPVVFVPGITDFADEYDAVFDLFGSRRLVVVELRGRGGSDSPPSGYSVPDQASDVVAVTEESEIGRFHLMTFSRGTTPGLEVALAQPDRVASISIGDYLAVEIGLPDGFAANMYASSWRGRPMPERVSLHVLEGIERASRAREMWDQVGALGVPVLVARGGAGGILGDAQIERYRASVPGVEVVTIPGSGHDLFRPDRTAYPRAVLDLIARRCQGE